MEESKEIKGMEGTKVHPLLMPEVLADVFQYLHVKDLLNCRMVHSAWNAEASPLVGTIIKTTLENESQFENILNLTKKYPNHPYRTFELLDVQLSFENPIFEQFLTVVGPYIHHLIIWHSRDAYETDISIRTLRDIFLYYVPNLRSLTMYTLPGSIASKPYLFPPSGYPSHFRPSLPFLKSLTIFSDYNVQQTFLEDLLSLSSSIEAITVKYGIHPGDFKQKLINAMLNKKGNLKNLKSFKYFMHDFGPRSGWSWTAEECEKLTKSGWSLQVLKLNPATTDSDSGFIHLMETLKNCLTRLTIRVHHPLRFPQLNSLVSLMLFDYEENLCFLESLPSLRYLGLCEFFPSKTVTSDNIIKRPCNSLSSLNLFASTVPDHLFKKILQCVPNLRRLNLWNCTEKKFRHVVRFCKFLEDLVINVSSMDDEALTGIPSNVCEEIERRLKNNASYSDICDGLENRCNWRIENLKYLQRLEIHGACLSEWKWSSIGDVSVIFGIANIPTLTSLLIKEFKWISEEALKKIVTSTPLQQLKIDPREYRESLESEIRSIKPKLRIEHFSDDYEQYIPRGLRNFSCEFVDVDSPPFEIEGGREEVFPFPLP